MLKRIQEFLWRQRNDYFFLFYFIFFFGKKFIATYETIFQNKQEEDLI